MVLTLEKYQWHFLYTNKGIKRLRVSEIVTPNVQSGPVQLAANRQTPKRLKSWRYQCPIKKAKPKVGFGFVHFEFRLRLIAGIAAVQRRDVGGILADAVQSCVLASTAQVWVVLEPEAG